MYPVQELDKFFCISVVNALCPLSILLSVKDVADLVAKVNRRIVEAFQGVVSGERGTPSRKKSKCGQTNIWLREN